VTGPALESLVIRVFRKVIPAKMIVRFGAGVAALFCANARFLGSSVPRFLGSSVSRHDSPAWLSCSFSAVWITKSLPSFRLDFRQFDLTKLGKVRAIA
jgi:hypothetical protein